MAVAETRGPLEDRLRLSQPDLKACLMTSQLILMNGFGVAMASDSAMTFGNGRVYETGEKIFPLEDPHRVAVLHSGNVFLQDYPFQSLISEWAKSLGSVQLRSVESYTDNFISWINDNSGLFSKVKQRSWLESMVQRRLKQIWDHSKKGPASEPNATSANVNTLIQTWTKELQDLSENYSMWGDSPQKALEPLEEFIEDEIKYWFDDVPTDSQTSSLLRTDLEAFVKYGLWYDEAVLAFCGYGSNEVMPSYFTLIVRGVALDRFVYKFGNSLEYSPDANRKHFAIVPLAQRSTIDEFLRGIEFSTQDLIRDLVSYATSETVKAIRGPSYDPKNLEEETGDLVSKMLKVVDSEINEQILEAHQNRVTEVIPSLPVASLASYASALIELVSLRLSLEGDHNTVGGPIDVATITRSHGFEWTRHKNRVL